MNLLRSLRRREKDIFEELEKEEDDVDKMIDDYVAQQVEEDKKPKQERPKPKPRDPNAPPRKRRKRTPSPDMAEEEEEECTQRGRDILYRAGRPIFCKVLLCFSM